MTENCIEHCINIWGAIGLQQNLAEVLGLGKPTMVCIFEGVHYCHSTDLIHLNLLYSCWCLGSCWGHLIPTGILLWELASLRLYVFDTVCSSSSCFTAHQLQLNWLFPFFIQMSFRLSACKVVSLQLRRSYHSITKPTNRSIRNGIPKTFLLPWTWTTNMCINGMYMMDILPTFNLNCWHVHRMVYTWFRNCPAFGCFFLIHYLPVFISFHRCRPGCYIPFIWRDWAGGCVRFNSLK